MILPFSVQVILFLLTHAQKFKYQPSHLNVNKVQNHISEATEASYMYGHITIRVPDLWCNNTMMKYVIMDFLISLLKSLWLGSLTIGVLKPTEAPNNTLYT